MFTQIIILVILAYAKDITQLLVFGKDEDGHFCDFAFSPNEAVSDVTIFEVLDSKRDNAVARVRLVPTSSPKSQGYSRIEIPDDLAVEGVLYSFQYTLEEGGNAFSENWTYDPERQQFALASAVKPKFWKNPKFIIAAGIGGVLGAALITSMVLRRMKKSRSTL